MLCRMWVLPQLMVVFRVALYLLLLLKCLAVGDDVNILVLLSCLLPTDMVNTQKSTVSVHTFLHIAIKSLESHSAVQKLFQYFRA